MTYDHDFTFELEDRRETLEDTIARDEIHARATAQAHATGFARLILEHGRSDREPVDGREPNALSPARLRRAKIHVLLDRP